MAKKVVKVLRKVEPKTEKHEFEMAPELLMNVIQQQAGTIGKAIYEGVMNAVDAKAAECRISLTEDVLIIQDNGGGMRDKDEILTRWKFFGQPQSQDEKDRKSFGRYRMGRGQLFSFGKNTWRTGRFQLVTDIKHWAKKFELTEGLKLAEGCQIAINLYDKLSMIEQSDVAREVKKLVKWVSVNHNIKVFFNDKEISKHPAEQTKGFWDYETDKLWLRVTEGQTGLDVYHMGGFIKTFSNWEFGVSGELVSKVPMDVNFARNDIMVSKCPVWKEAKQFANQAAGKEIKKRATLDDAARQRIANQILASEISFKEYKDARIFTDVCGRHWSLKQLRYSGYKFREKCSSAPSGSRAGDKIHQAKIAFVFSDATLTRFNVESVDELLEAFREWDIEAGSHSYKFEAVPFAELEKGFDTNHELIPADDWGLDEKVVVQLCDRLGHWFSNALEVAPRRIVVGLSGSADGWTDGATYIALNRSWLEKLEPGMVQDMVEIGSLLLHEYCHDESDLASHTHSLEFYQRYHDAYSDLASFVHEAVGRLPNLYETMGRELTRKQMHEQDRVRKTLEAQDKFYETAARGANAEN